MIEKGVVGVLVPMVHGLLLLARQVFKSLKGTNGPFGVGYDNPLGNNFKFVKVDAKLDSGKHKAVQPLSDRPKGKKNKVYIFCGHDRSNCDLGFLQSLKCIYKGGNHRKEIWAHQGVLWWRQLKQWRKLLGLSTLWLSIVKFLRL